MYEKFYHLKENPFNVTSDPVFFFSSSRHAEAFAHLTYGIEHRKGILLITGEVGTGKTTLCRTLLHRYRSHLENNVKTALILNPSFTDQQLLQLILKDFGIQGNFENKFDLINALNEFLLEETGNGHNVVLIIDEAQNLGVEQLEQIRLLSNLETEKEKLLQIILIGQPELCEKLELPSLRQLNQRIAVRYKLLSLRRDEVKKYIKHRLKIASSENSKDMVRFTNKAIDTIYESCKGTPRMINIICDRALLAGFTSEKFTINKDIIYKCIKEIDIKTYDRQRGLQNYQDDFKPDQMIQGSTRKKMIWYKNIYVLLCIFIAVGGIVYTVLDSRDQLFLFLKLKPSDQENILAQSDLSVLPSFFPIQENAVLPEPVQPGLVGESEEKMDELYNSGYDLYRQGNYKEAMEWFRKAAAQSHVQSQSSIGFMFAQGKGVKRDYKEALKWYLKAAEQGDVQAQAILGIMYSNGQGVEQDLKEAARWSIKAAEQGNNYTMKVLKRLDQGNHDGNFLIDLQKSMD